MIFYYFLFVSIALSLIALLMRYFLLPKRNAADGLFAQALKNENSGHYEQALLTYESVLDQIKRNRFNAIPQSKVIQKLKVLHTIIEYRKNFHLID
jgi:Na+/H+-dicarboxylate symporter